jgi:hypothetical protein
MIAANEEENACKIKCYTIYFVHLDEKRLPSGLS